MEHDDTCAKQVSLGDVLVELEGQQVRVSDPRCALRGAEGIDLLAGGNDRQWRWESQAIVLSEA